MKSFCVFLLSLLLVTKAAATTIRVAAAVSLKEAVTLIAADYQAQGGDKIEFVFGASGQLEAQIRTGAPVDVFISAANQQVDELAKAGLIDAATRRVVAHNELVLIVPARADKLVTGFTSLSAPGVKRVAIGQPDTVPAGRYARETLETLGLAAGLKPRLVYGASVRQVLDYVERGEVDAGLVYRTDALEAGDKVRVVAGAEESAHEPIVYPGVVLKGSQHAAAAKKFLEYLGSEKARAILGKQGFPDARPVTTAPATTAPATRPAM